MDYKAARIWQNVLLFGGAVVSAIGVWAFDSMPIMLVGLGMMIFSIIAWWRYYRCPKCGAWLASTPEPEQKKKIQHKKKKH